MEITNIHEAKAQLSKLVERTLARRKSSSRGPASRWFVLYPSPKVMPLGRGANGMADSSLLAASAPMFPSSSKLLQYLALSEPTRA